MSTPLNLGPTPGYVPPTGLQVYDWVLVAGLAYMFFGTDFTNGVLGGLGEGQRTDPDRNFWQKYLYAVHAKNDPMMRAGPEPLYGRPDKLPPFLTSMGYTNTILAATFEVLLAIGLLNGIYKKPKGGPIPTWLRFTSAAFIYRGITEIMYGLQLNFNTVAPLIGTNNLLYWIIALPQIYIPFLIAERFYEGTYEYVFNPLRFILFLAIPTILIIVGVLIYQT